MSFAALIRRCEGRGAETIRGERISRRLSELLDVALGIKRSVIRYSVRAICIGAVAQCWFEDDPQVAQAVERAHGRDRAKLADYLLQSVIARRRDRWAEIVLRTALWMREAPQAADLCWRELAIVANALADGRDMTEIGLMRDIALRTIAVVRDAGRM
jgi:DNA-binding NarL/FixJ family response regulator